MKLFFFLLVISTSSILSERKVKELVVKEAKVQFLSEAPHESIRGVVSEVTGIANLDTNKVSIHINLNTLKVPNRMMNDHMHENYLETDQFPIASFVGAITKWDLKSKTVEIEGELNLHGMTKSNFKIQGKILEREDGILIRSQFDIFLSEFKIEIPKLLILKLNDKISIESDILWEHKK